MLTIVPPGFWVHGPFSKWATDLVTGGTSVGTVITDATYKLECNKCKANTTVIIDEQDGKWAKGHCASCKRPYLVYIE